MATEEFQHIIRIVGQDIYGENKTIIGISQVKGIGYNLANAILNILKIDPNGNIGQLTDSQIHAIEDAVKDPSSINLPPWFLNRRKDIETGNDLHFITSDVDLNVRNDIEREKNTNSWRGFRHTFGLKVRGQRTRTTGRKGGAVGVKKGGKILPPGVVPSAPGTAEEGAVPEGAPAKEVKKASTPPKSSSKEEKK